MQLSVLQSQLRMIDWVPHAMLYYARVSILDLTESQAICPGELVGTWVDDPREDRWSARWRLWWWCAYAVAHVLIVFVELCCS